MTSFTAIIERNLDVFTPFLECHIEISHNLFSVKSEKVAFFVAEIKQTYRLLAQQTNSEYAEIYAQKLVKQFDGLKQAVDLLAKSNRAKTDFRSGYHFSKNIHRLPPHKRLIEYNNALRALNEKISWLTEQSIRSEDEQEKRAYLSQMQETEYRKQKCLAAIDELEISLNKN
ncbi:primosomal replication protein PriC [Glaesserella sp.]|uniref:primosomal replication protein PriC n=1 Tax=Glaesserella sp. TaxID=2094731 RepID=UPI00359F4649